MSKLLYKEMKLCFNPMIPVFYAFAFMLLIPNYMYQVPFFFTTNALFYMFQRCVLNNDVLYSALLPVSKRYYVNAKFLYVIIVQMIMLILYVPMIFLNHAVVQQGNSAGVDANVTLIGMGFIVFAIFNSIFMPSFFKTGYKAGKSFLISTIGIFVWIMISEGFFLASNAAREAVPFFGWVCEHLDCWPGTKEALLAQLIVLLAGAVIYAVTTAVSLNISRNRFEKVDL